MLPTLVFLFILTLAISLIYYFSNLHRIKNKERGKKIISFSAGVSVTYVLLELFPTFTEMALSINKLIFISLPIGFIAHHIIEKEIYKHSTRYELKRMLSLEENIFSFGYHVVIGVVLVNFVTQNYIQSILFFIPLASYTFLNNLPTHPHRSKIKSVILSSATTLGAGLGLGLGKLITPTLQSILIGIVTGVLLFAIIRHHIPFGKKGKIGYFTVGFLIYSMVIITSWYI